MSNPYEPDEEWMNAPMGIPLSKTRMEEPWLSLTYPSFLDNRLCHWLWKKLCCPRGWHLFDECQSLDDHMLNCDACGYELPIDRELISKD